MGKQKSSVKKSWDGVNKISTMHIISTKKFTLYSLKSTNIFPLPTTNEPFFMSLSDLPHPHESIRETYILKAMELSSSIKDSWKVFILGTIISCLMLLLFLTESDQKSSLSGASINFLQKSSPLQESSSSTMPLMAPQPSIIAGYDESFVGTTFNGEEVKASTIAESPKASLPPFSSKNVNLMSPVESLHSRVTLYHKFSFLGSNFCVGSGCSLFIYFLSFLAF